MPICYLYNLRSHGFTRDTFIPNMSNLFIYDNLLYYGCKLYGVKRVSCIIRFPLYCIIVPVPCAIIKYGSSSDIWYAFQPLKWEVTHTILYISYSIANS